MPALPDQPTTAREDVFRAMRSTASPPRRVAEQMLDAFAAAVRAAAFAEIADDIVAHCFGHTIDAAEGWIDCHCEVADDLLRRLAAAPTTTTPEEH